MCRRWRTIIGVTIIIGAGLYIFLRERQLGARGAGGQSAGVRAYRKQERSS